MKERKYLIVVDMQNDFIDGSLGTAEAEAIVGNAVERIHACRAEGYKVIATLDTHDENYLKTSEGKKLPVVHCVRNTEGWQLHREIRQAMGDAMKIEKPAFGSVRLPRILQDELEPGDSLRIELIGLCTDICVVSNALLLKAFFPEAGICVNTHCCAGVTPEKHRAAIETMKSCQIDMI